MTGGFLSAPIMRPNHCWTLLHVSVWAVLLLTLNADSEDSICEIAVRVRRNTAYDALVGDDFRINCTVVFCNNPPPQVTWYKRETNDISVNVNSSNHIKTEWEGLNHLEGMSFLIFKNIFINDSGEYYCRSGGSVGHAINVSVHVRDGEHTNVTQKNKTSLGNEPSEKLWLYVYTAAGILAFVILVIIISVASMQGCKGKSKKEMQTENQYMAIPMAEQPFPHASLQPPPRGSPSAPPSQRSTRRKTPPSQPNELPLSRDNERLYGKVNGNRGRKRNTVEEEGGSVVYAALNHQLPAGAAARLWRPQEERSEYAAIRVKDPTPTRH